jgi:CDGSH-type Zn-finger protein
MEPPTARDPGRIRVQPNGPYLVTGGVGLTRRSIVESEHGEPLTWQTTAAVPTRDVYALCRCGGSANKPFCDGTHTQNGFDGTETAPESSYDERSRTYRGTRVVVRDDRSLCVHAGFCGNRVTNVWNMVRGTDTEDSIARGQMMAMIDHCPSGALSYRLVEDGPDIEAELPGSIGVTPDGPLYVTGGVDVESGVGRTYEARNRVTLCRCGASAKKPLCDGSHKEAGFQDG